MVKDHLGNDALDYGEIRELKKKYTDNSFVFITRNMVGDREGFVLFITDHHDKAWEWKCEFIEKMDKEGKGPNVFVSVNDGTNYHRKRMDGFMGVNF